MKHEIAVVLFEQVKHSHNWVLLSPNDIRELFKYIDNDEWYINGSICFNPKIKLEDITDDTYAIHYMATGWCCCYVGEDEAISGVEEWTKQKWIKP